MIDDEDVEAWYNFPNDRNFFNKLWLADQLGHKCGPGGIPVPDAGTYIVRPTYNLAGMGVGAKKMELSPEEWNTGAVPAGYFWCEYLEGDHYSATYFKEDKEWKLLHNWQGWNDKSNVIKFTRWLKLDTAPKLPKELAEIDIPIINVEYKGNNPIEIHFRPSGNPDGTTDDQWNEYIPIWQDTSENYKNSLVEQGYIWIDNPFEDWYEDIEPYFHERRLGYYVR